ncbi:MAG: dihydropteroate synthase [Actinobacteria bacterium]|nr:dihydropteroate synthase [Actinomycetota bacterium]
MLIIGEKINVMSKTIGPAMKAREAKPIQELAMAQVSAGANVLDVNLGPASKGGPEMMEWLVKTIQEVADVPLSLDTTNAEAIAAGLKAHKGQAIINSTDGRRERIEAILPLAKEHAAKVIGLTMAEAGIPRDANERVAIAVDIMTAFMEYDIPLDRLYLDPLILPIGVAQNQALEAIEAVRMFKQLNDPPLKTVVGLSNVYNGTPPPLHAAIGSTFLVMLMAAGLDAAIVDPQDRRMIEAIKTAKLIQNEILYCHSYLD